MEETCDESKSKKQELEEHIKDPIHGSVELHPLLYKIINTEEFNRLKFIRQLGGVFCVYPGATHTRFEHSIGVCHLAGTFIRRLKEKQPELDITDKEVLCVEIAGLCHDLGHGPFSHVFDKNVLNECGKEKDMKEKLKHEDISLHILDMVYKRLKSEFDDEFQDSKDEDSLEMIKGMIHPTRSSKDIEIFMKAKRARYFLYQIVANKETGIDVDKWDYFMRDCHYMGIPHDFDWKRLMQLSRVIDVKETLEGADYLCKKICFNQKEISNIIGMFRTRFNLHQKAYQHKAVLAVEERLSTALLKVKDEPLVFDIERCGHKTGQLSLSAIYEQLKMKPANVSGYLALTDDIVHIIMHKKKSEADCEDAEANLTKASELIRDVFYRRKKFHFVKKVETTESAIEMLKEGIAEKLKSKDKFQADCIFCKYVEFSYFSESKRIKPVTDTQSNTEMNSGTPTSKDMSNPMNTSLADIHFFSKNAPNEARTFIKEELCQQFIPRQFESREVWLYNGHETKDIDDETLSNAADEWSRSCSLERK